MRLVEGLGILRLAGRRRRSDAAPGSVSAGVHSSVAVSGNSGYPGNIRAEPAHGGRFAPWHGFAAWMRLQWQAVVPLRLHGRWPREGGRACWTTGSGLGPSLAKLGTELSGPRGSSPDIRVAGSEWLMSRAPVHCDSKCLDFSEWSNYWLPGGARKNDIEGNEGSDFQ